VDETLDEYGPAADYYDYLDLYAGRADVSFFVDLAHESGGPVLELGCGTGRVLLPIARAGTEITGLDLSQGMLAVLKRRLAEEPPEVQARVRLLEGDMRDFDLGRKYALVTIPFRPFQHLTTVEDETSCLAAVRRHLQPGGRLVLDLFNPSLTALTDDSRSVEQAPEQGAVLPDGRRFYRTWRIVERNYFTQVQQVEMYYYVTYPDGRQERVVHAFPMRWLYRFEAEHLLARCGFEVEHLYADHDKNEYGSKYPGELIFVARRLRD
jgi:SAM-dependent methyltransferase